MKSKTFIKIAKFWSLSAAQSSLKYVLLWSLANCIAHFIISCDKPVLAYFLRTHNLCKNNESFCWSCYVTNDETFHCFTSISPSYPLLQSYSIMFAACIALSSPNNLPTTYKAASMPTDTPADKTIFPLSMYRASSIISVDAGTTSFNSLIAERLVVTFNPSIDFEVFSAVACRDKDFKRSCKI